MNDLLRDVLVGPATVLVFCVLVVPFLLGVADTRLLTPLAAPSYLILLAMTVVGSYLVPQYLFWLYWPPFLLVCYALSVLCSGLYYAVRRTR
ncbi:hypothetical protein [Natronorarus salvus]|uniref:hypothetical protein n=1 Tax=Natronorarus salvus TaxID=3117733 RepID=UPI002F260327